MQNPLTYKTHRANPLQTKANKTPLPQISRIFFFLTKALNISTDSVAFFKYTLCSWKS